MKKLKQLIVQALITTLVLQPILACATEYRIPLKVRATSDTTNPSNGPGTGNGDVEVGDGPNAPALVFAPAKLTFDVSRASDTLRTSLLTNEGGGPAVLKGFVSNSSFSIHHDCPISLAPGDSCLVSATPAEGSTAGASYSMMVMAQGTAKSSVLQLSTVKKVIGEGMPSLVLSQDMVNLGEVAPGVATAGSVVLSNEGKGAANLRGIGSNSEFTITSNCPNDLAPGASCTIAATFVSTINNTRSIRLLLRTATEDDGVPLTFYAKVIGGITPAPDLAFSADALPFGTVDVGASVTKQAILFNRGTAAAELAPFSSTEDFSVSSNCPSSLAAASQCDISVAFTGRVSGTHPSHVLAGAVKGAPVENATKLYLGGAVKGSPVEQHGPQLTFVPDTAEFGTLPVGQATSKQVVLSNTGDEVAIIQHIDGDSAAGEFSQKNDCPSTLVPGAFCTLTVTHLPAAQDLRIGRITVYTGNEQKSILSAWSFGVQATLGVSPAAVEYAGVALTNKLPAKPVAVGNGGNIPLTGITVTNKDPRLVIDMGSCKESLAPKHNCTVLVSYSPASDGPFSTSFQVHSANGGSVTVPVTGTAFRLSTNPATLSFPTTIVGTAAADQYATLTNEGQMAVKLDGIQMGYGVESFNQSNNCGTVLAAGASCTITARFIPNEAKPRGGTIIVSVGQSLAAYVALDGVGTQPRLTLSSSSLGFPSINAGRTSEPLSVIVSNDTAYHATVTGISVVENPAEFAQSNNCDTALPPGSSCTINVQWSPKSKTLSTGSVVIENSMGTDVIALGGLPTQPIGGIEAPGVPGGGSAPGGGGGPDEPYVITFPDTQVSVSSGVRNITFSNSGNGPLAVKGISVVSGMTDFAQSNNCGTAIPAGSSCVISMKFTPAAAGKRTGVIFISSETGDYQFNLSGNGIGSVVQLYAESSTDFGEVLVGSTAQRTFTFRNNGTVPAQNVKASVDGTGVSLVSNTCGSDDALKVIQPDNSCSMVVEFAPKAAGNLDALLAVDSNAANGTQRLSLSGKAIHAVGRLSADSGTSFGIVSTGSTSSLTFTFLNKGDAPATGMYAKIDGTDMRFSANSCGAEDSRVSLGVDKVCTMTVNFAPTAQGQMTGTLTVYSSATNGPQSVELSGGAKFSTNGYALQFNGSDGATNLVDVGTGSKWTSFNGASITTSIYKEGSGSLNFNGVNQAVSGPTIAYTGDFVFSTWIRQTARPGNAATIVAQWDQSSGRSTGGWALSSDAAGRLLVSWAPVNMNSAFMSSTAALPLNKWTHVALVHAGTSFTVYMDGAVVASGTGQGQLEALNVPTSLGSYFNFSRVMGAGEFFKGQMDDVRIVTGSSTFDFNSLRSTLSAPSTDFGSVGVSERVTKQVVVTNSGARPATVATATASGEFSVTDVAACTAKTLAPGASCSVTVAFQPSGNGVRTGSMTISSDSVNPDLTVSLTGTGTGLTALKLLGEASDIVDSAGATLTKGGAIALTSNNPVDGTGSLLFPAIGAYLVTPASTKYTLAANDFTIEAWVRPTASGKAAVMSNFPDGTWLPNSWAVTTSHPNVGNKAALFSNNYDYNYPVIASKSDIPLNKWTHIAITRTGATFQLYVNGALESTATFAGAVDAGATIARQLGIARMDAGWGFVGQMDDVRVVKGQNIYSGTFTPPVNMQ